MALYAFDGTSNKDNPGTGEDTNVLKFFQAVPEDSNNFYVEGVGTRYGVIGAAVGGAFGAGGHDRVEEARAKLEENFARNDTDIDIIGFSRGAALALDFANDIKDGLLTVGSPPIRFLGLWDTVASFGVPGNNVNLGYELTVPPNVSFCRHAISLDERRFTFPLTRVTQDTYTGKGQNDIEEVWFRGYHSDVGGSNNNEGLSDIALYWMFKRAEAVGLVFDREHVDRAELGRDPAAMPKTPGMDLRGNRKRTIRANDRVHVSVIRTGDAGRFPANNPPQGLAVVDDSGGVLDEGFEE